jgi:hypothetical protein
MTRNTANIRLWVDALRSGEYKQGKGYLNEAGRYCCLGVACDVSGLGTWEKNTDRFSSAEARLYLGDEYGLPKEVQKWLGIRSHDPSLRSGRAASTLNDEDGKTFLEIADILEKKYLS